MTVVYAHEYKGIVFEKGEAHIAFMYCANSGKIMETSSETHPHGIFLYKDIDDTTNKLLEGGWIIKEKYDRVEF